MSLSMEFPSSKQRLLVGRSNSPLEKEEEESSPRIKCADVVFTVVSGDLTHLVASSLGNIFQFCFQARRLSSILLNWS